jgi:hypothetical protein
MRLTTKDENGRVIVEDVTDANDLIGRLQGGWTRDVTGQKDGYILSYDPDNNLVDVPQNELVEAQKQGYRVLSEKEVDDHVLKEKVKAAPLSGTAGAFVRGFGRGASFGNVEGGLAAAGIEDQAVTEEIKAQSPVASFLGEVAGGAVMPSVGSVAGAVGKLAAKAAGKAVAKEIAPTVAKKIAKAAGSSAVEGALYGTGSLLSEASFNERNGINTGITGEMLFNNVGMGVLLGGGFGAGLSSAGAVLKAAKDNAPSIYAGITGFLSDKSKKDIEELLVDRAKRTKYFKKDADGLTIADKEIQGVASDIEGFERAKSGVIRDQENVRSARSLTQGGLREQALNLVKAATESEAELSTRLRKGVEELDPTGRPLNETEATTLNQVRGKIQESVDNLTDADLYEQAIAKRVKRDVDRHLQAGGTVSGTKTVEEASSTLNTTAGKLDKELDSKFEDTIDKDVARKNAESIRNSPLGEELQDAMNDRHSFEPLPSSTTAQVRINPKTGLWTRVRQEKEIYSGGPTEFAGKMKSKLGSDTNMILFEDDPTWYFKSELPVADITVNGTPRRMGLMDASSKSFANNVGIDQITPALRAFREGTPLPDFMPIKPSWQQGPKARVVYQQLYDIKKELDKYSKWGQAASEKDKMTVQAVRTLRGEVKAALENEALFGRDFAGQVKVVNEASSAFLDAQKAFLKEFGDLVPTKTGNKRVISTKKLVDFMEKNYNDPRFARKREAHDKFLAQLINTSSKEDLEGLISSVDAVQKELTDAGSKLNELPTQLQDLKKELSIKQKEFNKDKAKLEQYAKNIKDLRGASLSIGLGGVVGGVGGGIPGAVIGAGVGKAVSMALDPYEFVRAISLIENSKPYQAMKLIEKKTRDYRTMAGKGVRRAVIGNTVWQDADDHIAKLQEAQAVASDAPPTDTEHTGLEDPSAAQKNLLLREAVSANKEAFPDASKEMARLLGVGAKVLERYKPKAPETFEYLSGSRQYKPSESEKTAYREAFKAVVDPAAIMQSPTAIGVKVLLELYPNLVNFYREQVLDAIQEGRVDRQQVAALKHLLGITANYQQHYKQPENKQTNVKTEVF